jgi:DNA-binding response OmpR family regulator
LQAGGDDYLVKPVSMAELLSRLEALAARGAKQNGPDLVS